LIGAVVLLGVLAAAWLLYSRRDGLFPNSEIAESVQPADVLAPARALQAQGETAQAISRLRAVPESHPQRAEARSLIAQWETLLEEPDSAPSEEDLARRIDLIETARVAAGADRHTQAVDLLKEAAAIAPLDPAAADLAAASQEQLEGLGPAIDRFRQGDWEYALPDLWRARETDPGNRTVERLIVDSYYNLAVRDLQRRDVGLAGEKLTEAANLAPEDADLQRLQRFVDQYRGRSLDLRYRIFVKYLPFR
jgi:tetratricopeptide (TPR) repeat protein